MTGFRELLLNHIKTRPIDDPVWAYNSKLSGRGLAKLVDVPVPELLNVGDVDSLKQPQRSVCIKPNSGCAGYGVWLLRPAGSGKFRLIGNDDKPKVSWDYVVASCFKSEHMRHPNPHERVRGPWLVEVAIHNYKRPTDWKAFCIGGQVVCWRQMARHDSKMCKGWTREFEPAQLWKPGGARGIVDNTLPPPAYRSKLIEVADTIASHVPGPFIRVDLYEADKTVYFGEITPNPADGRYLWRPEWDRHLGDLWEDAL